MGCEAVEAAGVAVEAVGGAVVVLLCATVTVRVPAHDASVCDRRGMRHCRGVRDRPDAAAARDGDGTGGQGPDNNAFHPAHLPDKPAIFAYHPAGPGVTWRFSHRSKFRSSGAEGGRLSPVVVSAAPAWCARMLVPIISADAGGVARRYAASHLRGSCASSVWGAALVPAMASRSLDSPDSVWETRRVRT